MDYFAGYFYLLRIFIPAVLQKSFQSVCTGDDRISSDALAGDYIVRTILQTFPVSG